MQTKESKIHPTAIIDPKAKVAEGVEIGPYAVIGSEVTIGRGTKIWNHATVWGNTEIGCDCEIFPYAAVGMQTQDLKYSGGRPGTKIGDRTVIREYVSINAATDDGDFTVIGNDCYFLAYCHVGHGCRIGNHLIASNGATFAGHVIVEDYVNVGGGGTAIHQFCHIGKYAHVGGCSRVVQDVPPFMLGEGHPAKVRHFNKVGLERSGYGEAQLANIKFLFKTFFFRGLNRQQAIETVETSDYSSTRESRDFLEFVNNSERGLVSGPR